MDTFILIGITGIGLGALYFLVASGLSLIYGLMGVLNFAHGSFLTVGAFVGYWVASKLGPETSMTDFILAMIVGGLAAGAFALLIEQLLITRLYERHIDQALVTVGVSLVVGAVLAGWFGNDLIMFPTPMWFLTAINVGGAMIPADRVVYIATAVLLLIGNWILLKYTRIGLIIRAGVENRNMVNRWRKNSLAVALDHLFALRSIKSFTQMFLMNSWMSFRLNRTMSLSTTHR